MTRFALACLISVALAWAVALTAQTPQSQFWPRKDFGGHAPAQVLRLNGELIVVTHRGLFRRDPQSGRWIALGEARHYDAAAAFHHDLLTSSRELGLTRMNAQGRVLETPKDPMSSPTDFRKIGREGSGRIWVTGKRALLRLDGTAGALQLHIETLPRGGRCDDPCGSLPVPGYGGWRPANTTDIELDEAGRPWVGYEGGLAWLDRDVWRRLRIEPELTSVRSFALAGDVIWVAGRKTIDFFQLKKSGDHWAAAPFTPAGGYGTEETFFIKRDSRGWIWRGTTNGVHVSDGTHLEAENWLHISETSGFAIGEADNYGFFEDEDRSVWLAGDLGIAHLKPQSGWFDAPNGIPKVQAIARRAGGESVKLTGSGLSPFREYPYQCRLPGAPWRTSNNGIFEFPSLKEGTYTLEIGYAGNAAAVSSIRISVGNSSVPPVWPVLSFSAAFAFLTWRILLLDRFEPLRYRLAKLWFTIRRRNTRTEPEETPATNLTGRTLLGRYEVGGAVAHGGFSTVYAAIDQSTGKKAAIKHLCAPLRETRHRFTKEVAALRSIHHPGVVPVLDSWIDEDGEACLAMPFLEGPTLRARLRDAPLDPAEAAGVVRAVGAALGEMHVRGIVHRDLKPENIILTAAAGNASLPVLIDFGISGLRDRQDRLSVTRTLAGSFLYMAPESVTGHYSTASDVYSFAVLILEMLTLRKLLDIEAEFHDPEFVRELKDALRGVIVPERAGTLAEVLARAYNPVPSKRPPAEEFAAHIASLLTLAA